jgi:hypothetical protein
LNSNNEENNKIITNEENNKIITNEEKNKIITNEEKNKIITIIEEDNEKIQKIYTKNDTNKFLFECKNEFWDYYISLMNENNNSYFKELLILVNKLLIKV